MELHVPASRHEKYADGKIDPEAHRRILQLAAKGVGRTYAAALKMPGVAAFHLLRQNVCEETIICTDRVTIDYLRRTVPQETAEVCIILYLSAEHRLVGDDVFWSETMTACAGSHGAIVRRCLDLDARRLIVAHNKTDSSFFSSERDIAIIRSIAAAVIPCDVEIRDHVSVIRGYWVCFQPRNVVW